METSESERRAIEAKGRCETCEHLEVLHENQGRYNDFFVCLVDGCGCQDRLMPEAFAARERERRIAYKRQEAAKLRKWVDDGMPSGVYFRTYGCDAPQVSWADREAALKQELLAALAKLEADPEITGSQSSP